LWRFHRSPVGTVLVAIRENEERARFLGYPTNRYKLIGFVLSASVVAIAGTLSVFNHRFASAEPLAVAFSGELVAMVVIGGMRSFLGPALGALFFILFREFLSIWTPHWLFYFGLLFVGFIVFSPTGLVGVAGRVLAPFRKRITEAAAMAGRQIAADAKLPRIYRCDAASEARGAQRFAVWTSADALDDVHKPPAQLVTFLALSEMERAEAASLSYAGHRLLDVGLAIAARPRILLLDEPLAGLAAAERTRVASLLSTIAMEIPVLLVEHDIDRVFQIADHVTVMNEGKVLVDGTVEDARNDAKVREVYIGSGVAALAAKPRVSAAGATPILVVDSVDTFYGKSHILNSVSL